MLHSYEHKKPSIAKGVFIAPGAHVIGDVTLGEGASVWFNTVIRGDVHSIRIGRRSNIQDNSVVHVTTGTHATVVGDEVTVGHRVILHGCTVEDRALIGMGSVVLDGAVIGAEALIGAGSIVTPGTVIPPRVLALGSPCRVVRNLKPHEIQALAASAEHYHQLANKYINNI
jgi:carbonic anhydrase/acetyltransferase-like protein (isoleucine patch superfamily)